MSSNIPLVKEYLLHLQTNICESLEKSDGKVSFQKDPWQSPLGEGLTCILQNGAVIERGGVNFSHVKASALPPAALENRPELVGKPFEAVGVSLVIHPENPYVPTSHANFRYMEVENGAWWFGGGYDLTPYYGFKEDCQHWHQVAKQACDRWDPSLYPRFKKDCDDYFFLKHRNEPRGIGGLFFDDFHEKSFEESFALVKALGDSYCEAYLPLVEKRKNMPYTTRERNFQLMRRGRYVEFNLVYDRGTLFGLQSNGRTESILMSMPPEVKWEYRWEAEQGSPEAELLTDFLVAKNWV